MSNMILSKCPFEVRSSRGVSLIISPLSLSDSRVPSTTSRVYGFFLSWVGNPRDFTTFVARKFPVAPESIIAHSFRLCSSMSRNTCRLPLFVAIRNIDGGGESPLSVSASPSSSIPNSDGP